MPVDYEMIHYQMCPVCSSSISIWRIKNVSTDEYKIELCNSCGYAFINPRPSFDFLMEFYSLYGHGNEGNRIEPPDLEFIISQEQLDPNSTVDARRVIKTIKSLSPEKNRSQKFLDVGCGYGFFSKEALDAGFKVISLELAEIEREIAREMTGLNPVACSFEEYESAPSSFQVILMSHVLEHALDVNLWLRKANELLTVGGILAVALPNFGSIFRMLMQENEPYISPPTHLNFFNPQSLNRLMKLHGFNVEAIQWVSRIPKKSFKKQYGNPFQPFLHFASLAVLKTIDILRLGMIINVYGRKVVPDKPLF